MKKRHSSMVTLGISSLFLIFAVLCLVILALLTLGSSRSDLRMSKRSMEQTTAYYEACNTATGLCLQAEEYLRSAYEASSGETAYFEKAAALEEEGFLWDSQSRTLSFDVSFSDSQALRAEISVLYPQEEGDSVLMIHNWQTISTGTWMPDTKQPVYTKEATHD